MAQYPPGARGPGGSGPYGVTPPPPPAGPQYPGGGIVPYGAPPYGAPIAPYGAVAAPYGYDPLTRLPYSDRTKMGAGLLQIFLGHLGVGRFYTGHTALAVGQLVSCIVGLYILSWFTCGLSAFVVLWPLIDGIVILSSQSTDAQGRLLR